MHIHMLLDHYAYVHDALMYDACIHPWSLILDYAACVYDAAEILLRTDEQGNSRSRIYIGGEVDDRYVKNSKFWPEQDVLKRTAACLVSFGKGDLIIASVKRRSDIELYNCCIILKSDNVDESTWVCSRQLFSFSTWSDVCCYSLSTHT